MRKLPENPFAVFGKRRAAREQHEDHDEEEVVVARSRRPVRPASAPTKPNPKAVPVKAAKTIAAKTAPVKPNPMPVKATAPATPKPAPVQKTRTRKTTAVVKNPTSPSTSSPSSVFSSPSSAYSSLLSPSTAPPASTPSQQKNKIVPAIRAAAQQRLDRGQARTIEQASALELLSRIVGKNITMNDIEKERQAVTSSFALFSPPSELIALFDLASRFVESHQFYSRTV